MNALYLITGLLFLTLGGEILIRGSLAAASRFGLSPLLSGLVIVGFGTSSPELVVSVDAAINMRPDIAIGNVVGSNIGNILLILGISALITPMVVKPSVLRRDAVAVVGVTLLFIFVSSEGLLGVKDAIVLLIVLLVYLIWTYRSERSVAIASSNLYQAESEEISFVPKSLFAIVSAVIIGILLLIAGAKVFLTGALAIAENLGVSEAVIGLTLVAVGTSLPELFVSVIAALRRHADVAIGNILGSNLFNLLGILGISTLVEPLTINSRVLQFDQWVMLGASIVLLIFLYTGRKLSRAEGGILLSGYAAYIILSFYYFTA